MKRVLICANPDLNYIDGSSIWLQTISLVLAKTGQANIDFIAKSSIQRKELYQPIQENSAINIINGVESSLWQGKTLKRLTFSQLAQLAENLDKLNNYDVIVIRGFDIANDLINYPIILSKSWIYLTDIPQKLTEFNQEQKNAINKIALGCAKILCQTKEFIILWQQLVPELTDEKYFIYSPVIPDFDSDNFIPIMEREPIAIYAGKFKKEWMTLEIAKSWPSISSEVELSKLVMIGDKIHNESKPVNYLLQMKDALLQTSGLTWLGAMSRDNVMQELNQAKVGLSWRADSMDDVIEYSTKILEYGGAGCAVILNRNRMHVQMLGADYPLFANTKEDYKKQLKLALTNNDIAEKAAKKTTDLALKHTFSGRVKIVTGWLDGTEQSLSRKNSKIVVLVAGHDLKFFSLLQKELEKTGMFEFIIDQWQGHNKHDVDKSLDLLKQADVIFCEWCLGNLQWYSYNKLKHQRLIARFHAQESKLPYLLESNWDTMEHVVFVSEHIRKNILSNINFPHNKTSVISNYLDDSKFTMKKKTGEAKYTLGMIGVVPESKRLDRAIDLLELLLEKDERYCLRIKGKNPLEYEWLLKRKDELEYYQSIFIRINNNPLLRYKVIFDPPGDDVNNWFTMIGHILSPSDNESFHMAIGEGMLTGSYPVIWNWEGAKKIWGKHYIVNSSINARDLVLHNYEQINCGKVIPKAHLSNSVSTLEKWKTLILKYS